jgi:predicted DNA-binding transcriptional regulator YafY
MEAFWQFIMDMTGNHVTRYGIYIPGDPYMLLLWNELFVIILSFALVVMVLKVRGLERILNRVRQQASRNVEKPSGVVSSKPYTRENPVFSTIKKALKEGSCLFISYVDAEGELTNRVVEPQRVYSNNSHYYLEAFCHLRGSERDFRLDRVLAMKIVETDEHITPLDDHDYDVLDDLDSRH